MMMLKIIQENDKASELGNEKLNFKFHKTQGKFDFTYKSIDNNVFELKNCYCSINYFNDNLKDLIEYNSTQFEFSSDIKEFSDDIGKGLICLFRINNPENATIIFMIQVKIYDEKDFILVRVIDIIDKNLNPKSIHSISPLTIKNESLFLTGVNLPTNLSEISWFKNGWQSWSPNYVLFGKEKDIHRIPVKIARRVLDNQDYGIKGRFYSEYCTVITDLSSANSLILGFTTLKDQFSRIIFDYNNNQKFNFLTAIGCVDGIKLPESSINSSEELFIMFKTNRLGYYGLIDYAKVVNAYIQELRITEVPVGWCSWYYYYTGINQEEMNKNLDFFNIHKNSLPIDFFQLDDGYQAAIGDYDLLNEKFSDGLDSLFAKVNSAGFKGGIWTGPFFAVKKSQLFSKQPTWFLKKTGKNNLIKATFNWGAFLYALDLTKPEVLVHLKSLFCNLLNALKSSNANNEEALIQFFKIDFLHAAVPYDGDFTNKSLTRAQLYYNGVKAIREAITDVSFLLGCGAPLGPCVGLVDAMRIGTDTAPNWKTLDKIGEKIGFSAPSLKKALLPILYRSFMHKYFWINDPDCLMIRRTDTKLTLEEIQLQITLFGLSGGQILISDDMTKVSKEEINDAKLAIPPYNPDGYDAIPSDILFSKYPTIYMLETFEDIGKRYLAAIINWNDNIVSRKLYLKDIIPNLPEDEKKFLIFDFWNRKYLGEFSREQPIEFTIIKPHSCYYLNIIPVTEEMKKEPIFITSTLHVSQGCYEITEFEYDPDEKMLNIIIDLIGERMGYLYLKLNDNKRIIDCDCTFSELDPKENIWEIKMDFQDNISLSIQLS